MTHEVIEALLDIWLSYYYYTFKVGVFIWFFTILIQIGACYLGRWISGWWELYPETFWNLIKIPLSWVNNVICPACLQSQICWCRCGFW
jgi:hypothetical protein